MSWGAKHIDQVATESAPTDYYAFEQIGLEGIEDARILDVGCFDGYNTVLKFVPYDNISHVTGIDPETSALEQARERTDDQRFEWVCAAAEDFDAPDESYDVVYFSHVFQHVADKEKTLDNMLRLLKPGGHIIIKTFDDSCKVSQPDPKNVMRRLFALYESEVLPRTPHTRHTDRNNGSKCPTLLQHAGFDGINVKVFTTDTLGKTREERLALFERFTYFRANVPDGLPEQVAVEQKQLLASWKELFERDDYFHMSNTFIVTAQKPLQSSASSQAESLMPKSMGLENGRVICPMEEDNLGEVMRIEIDSFPDPWSPIAYAMELRHNPHAHYMVTAMAQGEIDGYIGWWESGAAATIMHIAVDPNKRRSGAGTALLDFACSQAAHSGAAVMQLQVRAENETARSFYKSCGFVEAGIAPGYYTSPVDDAVMMVKTL